MAKRIMIDNELHGLSLKEQTTFLWALCRYSNNPETCPFEKVPCENIPQLGWLDILKNRIPPETNR